MNTNMEHPLNQETIHTHRMILLKTCMPGIVHDLNNANNNAMMGIESLSEIWRTVGPMLDRINEERSGFKIGFLSYDELREEIPRMFSGVREGLTNIRSMTDEIRRYVYQGQDHGMEKIDPNGVVEAAAKLLMGYVRKFTNNFCLCYAKTLPPVHGNFQQLEQVVIHMIQDVCQTLPDRDSKLKIITDSQEEGKIITVEVSAENGNDVATENWQPVDPAPEIRYKGPSSFMDLSFAAWIASNHGGHLEVKTFPGPISHAVRMLVPGIHG